MFESNKIFLPLWSQYPGCSRCFWNRRTCGFAAQESPLQHNRGWINRRLSRSRGWSNPSGWCSGSVWLFLSGRKGSLRRSLGIQPPTWKKWIKLWSAYGERITNQLVKSSVVNGAVYLMTQNMLMFALYVDKSMKATLVPRSSHRLSTSSVSMMVLSSLVRLRSW